ncbi:hypothetical protein [uncultured Endozoicomonas sp.]|uniref:hypothetical protein n=1 Tax=uncultured Endozoicomonas sp. TaxID=432652 RepID=UPI00261957CF|nr:hypothetical protein [uncultured Endozoicomonas sp.]
MEEVDVKNQDIPYQLICWHDEITLLMESVFPRKTKKQSFKSLLGSDDVYGKNLLQSISSELEIQRKPDKSKELKQEFEKQMGSDSHRLLKAIKLTGIEAYDAFLAVLGQAGMSSLRGDVERVLNRQIPVSSSRFLLQTPFLERRSPASSRLDCLVTTASSETSFGMFTRGGLRSSYQGSAASRLKLSAHQTSVGNREHRSGGVLFASSSKLSGVSEDGSAEKGDSMSTAFNVFDEPTPATDDKGGKTPEGWAAFDDDDQKSNEPSSGDSG